MNNPRNEKGQFTKVSHNDDFREKDGTFKKGHSQPWYMESLYKRSGENHYNWKGGKHKDKSGYILIYLPGHPYARKGCVREHRLVAENALGRYLKPSEIVHHVNGIKGDNRNKNLIICTSSYHRWLEKRMVELYQKEHFGGV